MKKILMMLSIFFILFSSSNAQKITKEEMLLEAVGAFSGQNMYLTYLSLGNIADSYASGVYNNEFALQLTDELSEMIAMTIQKYDEMLSSKLIFGDDYNALMKFVDVYSALKEQSGGLRAMIVENKEDNIGKFERGRQKAWKQISEMLGLEN
ncbi:MAG: hypothetical protein KKA84_04840 [Bacteroidetes bacterium]|nr:hypothetical protein [Bacteroidota bacterium]